MSYIHPAALEARRRYWTRPDAYRFAPPGTPEAEMPGWLDPSATRVRLKEAQEEEARAVFTAELKRLQVQQDRLCEMMAELNYEFAWRKLCRKYGYNPDQPRDEQGRWTDGVNSVGNAAAAGGGEGDEATAHDDDSSSADEDAVLQPTQDRTDRLLNRHIIDNHVAKTDEELKARIRESQWRGLVARGGMDRNGSFDSVESARDFISQTIANNPGDVARVAGGEEGTKFLVWRFGYQIGREAILDAPDAEVRMRPTYEVGVLITHDARADFGYRVMNAFPRNFNPRTGR